jgi:hypothetical protein
MKLLHKIILPKVGKQLISKSKLFSYIDGDFKNWKLDDTTIAQKQELGVYELTEDMTFVQIFPNPEKMCLTQGQILKFIEEHKDKLRNNWYTFFLFKSKGKFFVADVRIYDDGALNVNVRRLEDDVLWGADRRLRLVLPLTGYDSLSLKPSDTLPTELVINGVKYIKGVGDGYSGSSAGGTGGCWYGDVMRDGYVERVKASQKKRNKRYGSLH